MRIVFVWRRLEKEIIQRSIAVVRLLCHFNDDNAGRDNLENFRERAVQLVHDVFACFGGGRRDRRRRFRFRGRRSGWWRGAKRQRAESGNKEKIDRKERAMSSGLDMKRRKPFNSNAGARDSKPSRELRRILPPRAARIADLPETDTHRKVPSLTRYLMPLTFCSKIKMVTLAAGKKDGKEFVSHAPGFWPDVAPELWNDWKWQLKNRVTSLAQLEQHLELSDEERSGVLLSGDKLALAVTPHFFNLIPREKNPDDPIRRQVIPRIEETWSSPYDMADPCGEDSHMPVPGLVHRYPDRVLFLVTDRCASYCRYCTRSRVVSGVGEQELHTDFEEAFKYLEQHTEVRDVL